MEVVQFYQEVLQALALWLQCKGKQFIRKPTIVILFDKLVFELKKYDKMYYWTFYKTITIILGHIAIIIIKFLESHTYLFSNNIRLENTKHKHVQINLVG